MRTLFLDCGMGAAGDMLSAALLELHPEPDIFIKKMNELNIPGVSISAVPAIKCGITGTGYKVMIDGEEEGGPAHGHYHAHSHHSLSDIRNIISSFDIPEKVRTDIDSVYMLIAEAESDAHDKPVSEIHFHEVGTMDAIADITSFCMLINELAPQRIVSTPVCTGYGHVHCAHGILPVPAPATAFILKDIPVYSGNIEGELCTPTGAALLKHFADSFEQMPAMKIEKTGYGMGKKDFAAANCVRAMIGESGLDREEIIELSFNVDDMSAEEISFASGRIFKAGAKEVFTTPVGMKKNRPGTLFTVLFEENIRDGILKAVFTYTTTIGVREVKKRRYTLDRKIQTVDTRFGPVNIKISEGYGIEKRKAEYDDLKRIAEKNGVSIPEVRVAIEAAYLSKRD